MFGDNPRGLRLLVKYAGFVPSPLLRDLACDVPGGIGPLVMTCLPGASGSAVYDAPSRRLQSLVEFGNAL
eukprot:6683028-Pyramimonas_sp.AAC.1